MPRKVTKKVGKRKTTEEISPEVLNSVVEESVSEKTPSKKFFYLGLALIIIVAILFFFKSLFLAAMVNGKPIFRWQLDRELEKRYGTQILDNLVTETLINQEAGKLKVKTTQEDINKELEAVKKTLPEGTELETALKAQNMTMEDFLKQIKIKLQAENILNPKISITDEEIAKFASESAAYFTSTDSAQQRQEATNILRQQKLGEAFNSWLQELESKAQILKF